MPSNGVDPSILRSANENRLDRPLFFDTWRVTEINSLSPTLIHA